MGLILKCWMNFIKLQQKTTGSMSMKKNRISIFELIVTAVIVLVVVQTFLEDFAVVMGFSAQALQVLMIAGFCFDLFFTIEFLVRLYNSRFEKGVLYYFVYDQGWVDFCASIPLLIFSSGLQMITFFSSRVGVVIGLSFTGFISMLKLIKIIRIARILRLLRMVKIFRSIKYADSPMAQRHLKKIVTIGVTILVVSFLVLTIVFETFGFSKAGQMYELKKQKILSALQRAEYTLNIDSYITHLRNTEDTHSILIIRTGGKIIYSRYSQDVYDSDYTTEDYEYRKDKYGIVEVFFDVKEENKALSRIQSRDNLIFFFIVLMFIGGYLLIYSPHFALTITDPIYVMKRGLDEENYNLEVKIPDLYKDDDVFKLARLYNEGYLPLKDRNIGNKDHSVLDAGLSDLTDLIDKE